MEDYSADKWITRQELADRYGVPVKTPAEWASKGTGPRYAKFGRHVRYRLSDVFEWERKQYAEDNRDTANVGLADGPSSTSTWQSMDHLRQSWPPTSSPPRSSKSSSAAYGSVRHQPRAWTPL